MRHPQLFHKITLCLQIQIWSPLSIGLHAMIDMKSYLEFSVYHLREFCSEWDVKKCLKFTRNTLNSSPTFSDFSAKNNSRISNGFTSTTPDSYLSLFIFLIVSNRLCFRGISRILQTINHQTRKVASCLAPHSSFHHISAPCVHHDSFRAAQSLHP